MKRVNVIVLAVIVLLSLNASSAGKISPVLEDKIIKNPGENVRVIVLAQDFQARQNVLLNEEDVLRTYSLIPGYSAQLSSGKIMVLARSQHVKRIFLDGVRSVQEPAVDGVGVRLQTSVDSIGAKYVQQQLNITGRNVTVAVIDTGIDYNHPDLGGCFGPSCRVKGGYDFYNNDADPMDDHSHGTHVAGIIGANGTITGVAPDVSFYALKVCDRYGQVCYDSDIIAAIDWAVTHNADIISISLGGSYQPNDGVGPLEQAVDEAVKRGFVVSIAAGNLGSGASTIEHPGDAGEVITVGASDDRGTKSTVDDLVASFSSRGPSAFGRLDPDVSAPGASIYSTMPGGSYGLKSGTSMAAPHVSGAAALLIEWMRNISPSQIRSLLIQSAENISGGLFDKGAGEINVSRAILSTLSVSVSGGDRFEGEVFSRVGESITLNFTNHGNATRNVSFTIEVFSDAKQYAILEPSSFTLPVRIELPVNESKSVQLNVSLPENVSAGIYGGVLVATSDDNQTLRVPVVLSVPLVGYGVSLGRVNVGDEDGGDWIYIPLKPANSFGLTVNLSFTGGSLDVFLLAPNGELVNYSNVSSNPKGFAAYNLSYDTYWALVHARSISGTVYFNLTLDYLSNFSILPSYWAGVYGGNTKEMIFTVTNDNEPKENISPSLTSIEENLRVDLNFSESIPKISSDPRNYSYRNLSCARKWLKKDLNISLNKTRYLDVNLSWNPNHNLDLYIVYWQDDGDGVFEAGEDKATRYASMHENTVLGENTESIEKADILYYTNNFFDLGVSICNQQNTSDFTGNITLSITTYGEEEFHQAEIYPNEINLSAHESKNITLSLNMTGLSRERQYNLTLIWGEHAQTPITVELGSPTTPEITPLGTYTNTSTILLSFTSSTSTVLIDHYVIEYSINPSFEPKNSVNSTVNQTNITLPDGLYFLRLKAVDLDGFESPLSNTVNITVDATPPTTPQIVSPTGDLLDYTPTINWTQSLDNTSGVRDYILQVSDEPSFTNLTLTLNTTEVSNQNTTFMDGQYFVRVKAFDNAGNSGNFSETSNFSVKTITLNEFQPTGAWIELYNTRTQNYSLSGWTLDSNGNNVMLSAQILSRLFLLANLTQTVVNISQSNGTITLRNQKGFAVDNVSYETIPENWSLGRSLDGGGLWAYFNESSKTPGISNYKTVSLTLPSSWSIISLPLKLEW